MAAKDNGTVLPDLGMAAMLLHRVRYLTAEFESVRRSISASLRFTDGAVIGSKGFVNEAFEAARERFGVRRKDGARKLRGGRCAGGWRAVECAGFADWGVEP